MEDALAKLRLTDILNAGIFLRLLNLLVAPLRAVFAIQ